MAKEKQTIVQSVILRPLDELVPNPKNPRTATDEEIAALAESIKANPDYFDARPIVLSNRTGVLMIIDGEQRSKAAKLLGMTEVPTILIEGLTEAQEDEIMVRGNTHAGKWSEKLLKSWSNEVLQKWGAPKWNEVTEEQLQGLFAEHTPKPKPTFIVIEIPIGEDVDAIKEAVENCLQFWPKCKVK